ncbi:MAG TPA: hypothetical protein VJ810_05960, partial [Blastocatellia bacterium]|nr:hypothetical protein [Blastocatellia bacterium]
SEMCEPDHPKYMTMIEALQEHSKKVADLFTRAWNSSELSDCPSLGEWRSALQNVKPATTKIQAESSASKSRRRSQNLTLETPLNLQTQFVSHVTCFECGARVRAVTPADHEATCSRHPDNFKPALDSDWLIQNPLLISNFGNHTRSLLDGILGEKDSICDECGYFFISNKPASSHKLTCSRHPRNKQRSPFSHLLNTEIGQLSNQLSPSPKPLFQTCQECSNLILNDDAKDHKETCSKHPDYQPPSLPLMSQPSILPSLSYETCDECGNQIKNDALGLSHKITCSKHPLHIPKPGLLDPPNTRIPRRGSRVPSLQNPFLNACEECNELIWNDDDKNHKITCSKHPDYQAPDLSYEICRECGILIFGGDIRNHKITCSKHPNYKPPTPSRFSDISFVPIEDVQTGGADPNPPFAFGLGDSEICGECYMTIRRVGTVEYGHLHRCSKKTYRIR